MQKEYIWKGKFTSTEKDSFNSGNYFAAQDKNGTGRLTVHKLCRVEQGARLLVGFYDDGEGEHWREQQSRLISIALSFPST